ncbi:MAG: M15 family metallopeptidase [Bacteroidaceae bacterium]|nr:M15 family metallopeptidase [Bacteroidaceae bacterium]
MNKIVSLLIIVLISLDISAQRVPEMSNWIARTIVCDSLVKAYGLDSCFVAEPISDRIFDRMKGKSWKADCTIRRDELRYVRVLHRNFKGENQMGELVVNRKVAQDIVYIFRRLYEAHYPIELMTLIDEYDADDERSMEANNTSCFNFRFITGSRSQISYHGRGCAIDLNPLYNPYIKGSIVSPSHGRPYAFRRDKSCPYIIDKSDLAYRLFRARGWRWGGNYRSIKDYQHFEK